MLTHNKNRSLFDAQPPRGSSRLHIVVPTLSTPYYPLVTSIDISGMVIRCHDFRLLKASMISASMISVS